MQIIGVPEVVFVCLLRSAHRNRVRIQTFGRTLSPPSLPFGPPCGFTVTATAPFGIDSQPSDRPIRRALRPHPFHRRCMSPCDYDLFLIQTTAESAFCEGLFRPTLRIPRKTSDPRDTRPIAERHGQGLPSLNSTRECAAALNSNQSIGRELWTREAQRGRVAARGPGKAIEPCRPMGLNVRLPNLTSRAGRKVGRAVLSDEAGASGTAARPTGSFPAGVIRQIPSPRLNNRGALPGIAEGKKTPHLHDVSASQILRGPPSKTGQNRDVSSCTTGTKKIHSNFKIFRRHYRLPRTPNRTNHKNRSPGPGRRETGSGRPGRNRLTGTPS